jgi:polyhydroxyalkanoate synthesis regulator phasin
MECHTVRAKQLAYARNVLADVELHCHSHQQIQLERRKVLMLQQQLEQLTSKLGTTRSAMGSIFSAKEKTQALQKQIKILENRLEKQYIKYNEVCQH